MVLVLQSNRIPIEEMMIIMNDNNNGDDKDASSLCYVHHYADEKHVSIEQFLDKSVYVFHNETKIEGQ